MPSEAEISGEGGFGLQKFPTQKLIFPYICSKKKLSCLIWIFLSQIMITTSWPFILSLLLQIFRTSQKIQFLKPRTNEEEGHIIGLLFASQERMKSLPCERQPSTLHLTTSTIHPTFTLTLQFLFSNSMALNILQPNNPFSTSTLYPPHSTLLIFWIERYSSTQIPIRVSSMC